MNFSFVVAMGAVIAVVIFVPLFWGDSWDPDE
jgi:hypothetical protein